MPPVQKLHYSDWTREGMTLCGRVISPVMRITADIHRITCTSCQASRLLDGQLGNMTHAGH